MPEPLNPAVQEKAVAILEEASHAYQTVYQVLPGDGEVRLCRSALHGLYDAFTYLAEAGFGYRYDLRPAAEDLEADEGGHQFRLKALATRLQIATSEPIFVQLDRLGNHRNRMAHFPYQTPTDVDVWRAVDAVASLFEMAAVDVRHVRDSLQPPGQDPLPPRPKSAFTCPDKSSEVRYVLTFLEEAVAAYERHLTRSALHSVYDVINFITDVFLGLGQKAVRHSFQWRLDFINKVGQHQMLLDRFCVGDAIHMKLSGIGVQRNGMAHSELHLGGEGFWTPATEQIYEDICTVVVLLSDLGLGLKRPYNFELPQRLLDLVPPYELANAEADNLSLRFQHPVWPTLEMSRYTSHELGVAFLAPITYAVRESSSSCTFELQNCLLSYSIAERPTDPAAWLRRQAIHGDLSIVPVQAGTYETAGVTWHWVEGIDEPTLTRELRYCRDIHGGRYLLQVHESGHNSFLIKAGPITLQILDNVSELAELPWQRYEQTINDIAGACYAEFEPALKVQYPPNGFSFKTAYGEVHPQIVIQRGRSSTGAMYEVFPASTLTEAKVRHLSWYSAITMDLRVCVADQCADQAVEVLRKLKIRCTLLKYLIGRDGTLKLSKAARAK